MTCKTNVSGKLGTFSGVFTPSVLTILGIILFLRLGFVTGSAGMGKALIIIAIANLISVITSSSLSAIATNLKVKGGGDYYLISRTLGVKFGGAIGLVLFMAQSVSVAFYCIGFAEATLHLLPESVLLSVRTLAASAMFFLFIFAWLGSDWASRFQYGVMVLLILALISFFWGALAGWNGQQLITNWSAPKEGLSFWVLFGIFFPAVTGFTQGVSMSGDLKDPSKSLPTGTFLAVGISIAVYFAVSILFAGNLENRQLFTDFNAMKSISKFGFLIDAGVIAATLSSAMASFLGAPRILQALSSDQIFSFMNLFSKGEGANNNPRRAVLLTLALAFATILLGQLNLIAPIVSMFFLISYALLNFATYYESSSKSPSFRPQFKWFNKNISLAGFILCACVMIALDVKNSIFALIILGGIYHYLNSTNVAARWSDSTRSFRIHTIRENLLAIGVSPEHTRDWIPKIIAFTRDSNRRTQLLTFATWIAGESGLITAASLIETKGAKALKIKADTMNQLKKDIADLNLPIIPLVVRVTDRSEAISILTQSYGMGPLKINTALFNCMEQAARGVTGIDALRYVQNLSTAFRQKTNVMVLLTDGEKWKKIAAIPPENRSIDIWWQNNATSRLMLMVAYLITTSEGWQQATIRVLTEAECTLNGDESECLPELLKDFRIKAKTQILKDPASETLAVEVSSATLSLMPFRIRSYKILDPFGNSFQRSYPKLPTTVLFLAAENLDLDAEPEEGVYIDITNALDSVSHAEKRVAGVTKMIEKSNDKIAELEEKLLDLSEKESIEEREKYIQYKKELEAETLKQKAASQKVAKERVILDDAILQAKEMGLRMEKK